METHRIGPAGELFPPGQKSRGVVSAATAAAQTVSLKSLSAGGQQRPGLLGWVFRMARLCSLQEALRPV